MLHFSNSIELKKAEIAARRFFGIVDVDALAKRVTNLSNDIHRNRLLRDHYKKLYELEFGLVTLALKLNDNFNIPMPRTRTEVRAIEFTFVFFNVYFDLASNQRRILLGKFLDGVKDEKGLASLELELSTISTLIVRGFRIAIGEAQLQRFDILAARDGIEFEIECKHVSEDSGRKIHMVPFVEFANFIFSSFRKLNRAAKSLLHLSLAIEGSLEANQKKMKLIAEKWRTEFESGQRSGSFENIFWCSHQKTVSNDPSDQTENIKKIAQDYLGRPDPLASIYGDKSGAWCLVTATSDRPDTLMLDLEKNLLRSAKVQFTGDRPSVLVVRFAGLSDEAVTEMYDLDKVGVTSLRKMATELLRRRPHLHTVYFRGFGDLTSTTERNNFVQTDMTRASGNAYIFENETCIHTHAVGVSLFLDRN